MKIAGVTSGDLGAIEVVEVRNLMQLDGDVLKIEANIAPKSHRNAASLHLRKKLHPKSHA